MSLFGREAAPTCPSSAFSACPDPVPFCCQTSTTCIPLDRASTSVLCCPKDAPNKCTTFSPVSCDIKSQDQSSNPNGVLFTNNFDTELPKCGNACCPLGYACKNGQCVQGRTVAALLSSSTTASVPSSTSAPTPDATDSVPAPPSPTAQLAKGPSRSNFPPGAVIVGLISGLIAGALITFGIIWLLKRRRERKQLQSKIEDSPDFGTRGPTVISDPITATPFGYEHAQYLRRTQSGRVVTPDDTRHNTPESARSNRRTPLFNNPLKYGLPVNPKEGPQRPPRIDDGRPAELDSQLVNPHDPSITDTKTKDDDPVPGIDRQNSDESYITTGTRDSRQRESTETISVGLMPPPLMTERSGRNDVMSTNTTFSQMMDKAGMRRGKGFAGYPGRYSFR